MNSFYVSESNTIKVRCLSIENYKLLKSFNFVIEIMAPSWQNTCHKRFLN